jgi:hypothetical protein
VVALTCQVLTTSPGSHRVELFTLMITRIDWLQSSPDFYVQVVTSIRGSIDERFEWIIEFCMAPRRERKAGQPNLGLSVREPYVLFDRTQGILSFDAEESS